MGPVPFVAVVRATTAPRWHTVLALALTLVALLPALAAVVVRAGSDYVPVQDLAIIDLRVRDVWSSAVPLVGPYSKGWNHPGPLMFWLLAVPSGVFGGAAWATPVGGALLQAGAIAGSARLAWRRGGLALLIVVLAVLGLSYSATGGWMLLDAWNPNIAFPFFVLFLLALWALTDGMRLAAVLATATATFLVQTHVGYLPLVAAPGAVAVGLVLLDARRTGASLRSWARALWWSLATAVVLWLPALLEQLIDHPGNLTRMWRYFTGSGDQTAGPTAAVELLAAEFRWPFPWLGGGEEYQLFSSAAERASATWLVIPVALLVLGFVAVARTRSRSDLHLLLLVVAASVAGVAAISQVPDEIEPYLFRWRTPLAVLVVAAVGLAVARWAGLEHHRRARLVTGAVLAAAGAVASVALAVDAFDAPEHLSRFEVAVERSADQIEGEGAALRPVLVRFAGSNAGGLWGGLIDELDRRAAPVRVDEQLDYQYGEPRTATPDDVAAVWYVVDDGYLLSTLGGLPDAEVVAEVTPLDDEDEADMAEAQRRLAAAAIEAGRPELLRTLDSTLVGFSLDGVPGVDREAANRVAELNEVVRSERSCRCGVVAFPPDSPSLQRVPELDP